MLNGVFHILGRQRFGRRHDQIVDQQCHQGSQHPGEKRHDPPQAANEALELDSPLAYSVGRRISCLHNLPVLVSFDDVIKVAAQKVEGCLWDAD